MDDIRHLIPKPLYGCRVCAEDVSYPADMLFLVKENIMSEGPGFYCEFCIDNHSWNTDERFSYTITLKDVLEKGVGNV